MTIIRIYIYDACIISKDNGRYPGVTILTLFMMKKYQYSRCYWDLKLGHTSKCLIFLCNFSGLTSAVLYTGTLADQDEAVGSTSRQTGPHQLHSLGKTSNSAVSLETLTVKKVAGWVGCV